MPIHFVMQVCGSNKFMMSVFPPSKDSQPALELSFHSKQLGFLILFVVDDIGQPKEFLSR
jgi:hypothetical protein